VVIGALVGTRLRYFEIHVDVIVCNKKPAGCTRRFRVAISPSIVATPSVRRVRSVLAGGGRVSNFPPMLRALATANSHRFGKLFVAEKLAD
jgi:hypothetical protein